MCCTFRYLFNTVWRPEKQMVLSVVGSRLMNSNKHCLDLTLTSGVNMSVYGRVFVLADPVASCPL